jgi:hypothetical protein
LERNTERSISEAGPDMKEGDYFAQVIKC